MPTLLSESIVTLEFADLLNRRPIARPSKPHARSAGLHQSGILAHIAQQNGQLKVGERLEEDMPTIFALGFAWEEYCVSLYPGIDWQPGELIKDEIGVSADGLPIGEDGMPQVEEFKYTTQRIQTGIGFLESQWMWQHQGRAYCHCYGALVERWHVMYSRGGKIDGVYEYWPVYKQFVVRFSRAETKATWSMLCNHKEAARAAGKEEIGL